MTTEPTGPYDESHWQPIETAPKDGTRILLYYPDYERKVWIGHYYNTERYEFGKLDSKSEGWAIGHGTFDSMFNNHPPTHWTALPKPPAR